MRMVIGFIDMDRVLLLLALLPICIGGMGFIGSIGCIGRIDSMGGIAAPGTVAVCWSWIC